MLFKLGSTRIKFYFDGTFRNQKALARYDWYQKIQFSKFKIFQGMMKSTLLNIDSGCMMKWTFLNIDSCWSDNDLWKIEDRKNFEDNLRFINS